MFRFLIDIILLIHCNNLRIKNNEEKINKNLTFTKSFILTFKIKKIIIILAYYIHLSLKNFRN